MYRYVYKRCKEAVEYGLHIRKSFACQNTLNNKHHVNQNEKNQELHQNKQNNSVIRFQEVNFLVPQQRVNYEDFKKKYNCKHPYSCNPFLHAITWSTALIAGFYASQLLCLYRRNKNFDPKRCFYTRYLQHKNKLLHRKFLCAKQAAEKAQQTTNRSLVPSSSLKFTCPFKKNSEQTKKEEYAKASSGDDELFKDFTNEFARLNLFDKRFKRFFNVDDDLTVGGHRKVFYSVNNDTLKQSKEYKQATSAEKNISLDVQNEKVEKKQTEDEAIDEIMSNLSEMIGELEFQMGVECVMHGNYEEGVEHFRMSSSTNNASSCFNLALLYEQGLGVKKDLEIAMQLYKMASDQGHDKALYNLGVYFARGLGGAKRSFKKAKSYFEKAALKGNLDAQQALSLLHLERKKSIVPDDFIVADEIGPISLVMSKNINYHKNLQSIAVT